VLVLSVTLTVDARSEIIYNQTRLEQTCLYIGTNLKSIYSFLKNLITKVVKQISYGEEKLLIHNEGKFEGLDKWIEENLE
jgi:hypothetical protein